MYIDLKEHGNIMRLINDCQEAPNLQLIYWPELDLEKGALPRRASLDYKLIACQLHVNCMSIAEVNCTLA